MDSTAFYAQRIGEHYPDLRIETVFFNQEGQYNDVLIVNNALVFRFAKVPAAVETLRQEISILHALQDCTSLAIPHPLYHNLETDAVGKAFVGYQMIPGKPLWREDFQAISDVHALERIAHQLAGFLCELHHVPFHDVIPITLPLSDTQKDWDNMYDQIRDRLFVHMRPEARRQVAKHFEDFLDNPDLYHFEPALRHGDFGTGNILYDPDSLSAVGVIDFGGIGLGDPATDFAALLASYGEEFYTRCYSVYPEMKQALKRVRFYCGTFALQEALFGIKNDDTEAFQSGMAKYV